MSSLLELILVKEKLMQTSYCTNDLSFWFCITALSTTQMLSLVMNKLYKQFVDKDIKDFDAFKVAIIDTFK